MPVQLNHTIVYASNQQRSANRLARLLGLPEPVRFGPFLVVELANGVCARLHGALRTGSTAALRVFW